MHGNILRTKSGISIGFNISKLITQITKFLAFVFLLIGGLTLLYFLNTASIDGYSISNDLRTDYEVTGQFGDFVGGVVGTFFALTGTLLIYLTFHEQAEENKRIAFESSFFEMMRIYRENVSELRYRKYKLGEHIVYENRQVVSIIFKEFIECYREVKKFSNSEVATDYLTPSYLEKLKSIIAKTNPNIDPVEMARIDIAYSIVFYGLSVEGESVLRKLFRKKYNPKYFFRLIFYMKLKPKKSNEERFESWSAARSLDLNELHKLINELYANRKHPEQVENLSPFAERFKLHQKYEKYYGGHQFRLGHYFRHLFQSYQYLNSHSELTEKEKYKYGKMYRAQLSNYEQALLLVNSISSIGMKWELSPEELPNKRIKSNLITKFNLVKNLPGDHLYGIRYKTYYKDVQYESDDQVI